VLRSGPIYHRAHYAEQEAARAGPRTEGMARPCPPLKAAARRSAMGLPPALTGEDAH